MNIGSNNQSIQKTCSFTVDVADTCIKDTFVLRVTFVNVISMRATFFSPFFVGVAGNLSKVTARLQTLVLLFFLGLKAKDVIPSQKRSTSKTGFV